jgi:glycosyltransferase involved in cell wall biosynthesis
MAFCNKVKNKVCFVSLYSYPLFNPSTNYLFGGSEIRAFFFGKALADLPEYEVSFIVFDHKQPEVERYGNVKVFRHSYYKDHSVSPQEVLGDVQGATSELNELGSSLLHDEPIMTIKRSVYNCIGFLSEHLKRAFGSVRKGHLTIGDYRIEPKKIQVYKEVDADIYCVFGVSNFSAEVAAFCKAFDKVFVLFLGSGSDDSEDYFHNSKKVNPYGSLGELCYYAIRKADFLVAQTRSQQVIFKERFQKKSTVISNPIDLSNNKVVNQINNNEKYALWIGKSDRVKQPEIMVKLAYIFKETKFIMILNCSDLNIFRKIIINIPKNVEVIERLDFESTDNLFRKALVFINTSVFEGFPNTFLQAGKYGVPILSLSVDPDDFIKRYSCGLVADGNFEQLSDGLRVIITDREKAREFSHNVKRYVSRFHDLESQARKLKNFFRGIYGR